MGPDTLDIADSRSSPSLEGRARNRKDGHKEQQRYLLAVPCKRCSPRLLPQALSVRLLLAPAELLILPTPQQHFWVPHPPTQVRRSPRWAPLQLLLVVPCLLAAPEGSVSTAMTPKPDSLTEVPRPGLLRPALPLVHSTDAEFQTNPWPPFAWAWTRGPAEVRWAPYVPLPGTPHMRPKQGS